MRGQAEMFLLIPQVIEVILITIFVTGIGYSTLRGMVEKISPVIDGLFDALSSEKEFAGRYTIGADQVIIFIPPSYKENYDEAEMVYKLINYYRVPPRLSLICVQRGCVISFKTKSRYFKENGNIVYCEYGYLTYKCFFKGNFSIIKDISQNIDPYSIEVRYPEEGRRFVYENMTFYYLTANGTMIVGLWKDRNYTVRVL